MAKYRKKPVVIEAQQVPTDDSDITEYLDAGLALANWCGGTAYLMNQDDEWGGPHILIPTLEGDMRAVPGDWIIRGVKGEFYPCKPDIFEATYDLAEDEHGNETPQRI